MSDCPPRWSTPRTKRPTLGGTAAKIAEELGTPLMPWQQHVLDVALEIDPKTKRLVYREVILTVPRQSGKTTLLLVLILLRALGASRQQIRYTAQTGADARKKFLDDWVPILEPTRFGGLYRLRLTNGHEALIFRNRSHFGLLATTKKTGHGTTLDLGILDEAFAHVDARLEQALKPAMLTRPQPQLWIVSTAGTPADSPYLMHKVRLGREAAEAKVTQGVAYFEWSAPDDADPGDSTTWAACMPALGRTVSEAAVRADFLSMDLPEFRRALLNQWTVTRHEPVIDLDLWRSLADRKSSIVGPLALAFDVPPDRSSACIAAAGKREDGLSHIEVIEAGPGTGWVAPRLAELGWHNPVAILCDASGPAGSLLPDLAARGVEVTPIAVRDNAKACGAFYDAVNGRQLRHLGTPELLAALEVATKRPSGDAWTWSRRSREVPISPLVACTLALWGSSSIAPVAEPQVWNLADFLPGGSLYDESQDDADDPLEEGSLLDADLRRRLLAEIEDA